LKLSLGLVVCPMLLAAELSPPWAVRF